MPRAARMPLRSLLFGSLLLASACAEPPTRELDQAQGAIETARAAGADRFAPEELKAATDALERANVAVTQRDYRQALSLALDAKERARDAARSGAERMARQRSEAEQAIDTAARALAAAEARLASPDTAKLARTQQAALRAGLKSASLTLQKARAAFDTQAFSDARAGADAALADVRQAMTTLSDTQMRSGRRPALRRPAPAVQ